MAKGKIHKSEDERIAALESIAATMQTRFDRLEERLGRNGSPAFFLAAVPTEVAQEPPPDCFESIQTSISGEHAYQNNVEGDTCPEPSPADKAQAAINARGNLLEFGKVWCNAGKCSEGQCRPILSGLRVDKYETTSRLQTNKKRTCVVVATVTGTVSCKCLR